ncbi:Gustatory receptor 92, partial [Hyalella azteca]
MKSKNQSLQRCFKVFTFMGFYLNLKNPTQTPMRQKQTVISPINVLNNQDVVNLNIHHDRRGWINKVNLIKASVLDNVKAFTWYFIMNALYLACCVFMYQKQDYTDTSITGLFDIAWFIFAPTMVLFSTIICIFSQKTFSKLFTVLASISNTGDSREIPTQKLNSNSCILLCFVFTRITRTYALIKTAMIHKNAGSNFIKIKILNYCVFFLMFAVAFVLVLSFNFFVGILKRTFEKNSKELAEHEASLDVFSAVASSCISGEIIATSSIGNGRDAGLLIKSDEFLREMERQMLLIDEALELINRGFSWILILLSCWFLTDFLFSIYLLLIALEIRNSEIESYIVFAVEAILFLLLMHNPADALSEAEEEFIVGLRRFIYRLPGHWISKPYTGLVMAIQRPRTLTLGNFGNVGRSSLLSTVAFMFSYLVVVIQFHIDGKHPAPSPSPTNAT